MKKRICYLVRRGVKLIYLHRKSETILSAYVCPFLQGSRVYLFLKRINIYNLKAYILLQFYVNAYL